MKTLLLIWFSVFYMYPQDSKTIFLVNKQWHTGIVIYKKDIPIKFAEDIMLNDDCNLIDIGWGDETYYTTPGFDFEIAFRALFIKTPSVVRVECVFLNTDYYLSMQDGVIKLILNEDQFTRLLDFTCLAFERNESRETILFKNSSSGNIKYFRSPLKYWLMNTCNTWVADAVREAGFDIDTGIITSEELFEAMNLFGEQIK